MAWIIGGMDPAREIKLNGLKICISAGEILATEEHILLRGSRIAITLPREPIRYFRHGWQSLSLSAWTDTGPFPVQRPVILHPFQQDPVYASERLPNGSWLGAVEFEHDRVLLLGSLGLESHVRLTGNLLEGWSEAGSVGWLVAYGSDASVFAEYSLKLGEIFGRIEKKPAPRVWCSWYSLYTTIDERSLAKVFRDLGDLPFDVLQVDDGWQLAIGDWEPNSKFPSGLSALAAQIRATGRSAGLWLAPLIATRSSRLFREHEEWFLKDDRGRFVSAGFNWGQLLHALDTTHPGVLEWLAALMRKVRAWGFDYLKLDFLSAGALPGRRYENIPRETAYRQGLQVIRAASGQDAYILASIAPILPTIGLCDALRIGPDVAGHWESQREAVLLFNHTTPGLRNAIRTSVHRLWLDQLVQLDPDVAYFGSRENDLTVGQKQVQQDMALICNFKAISELPHWLTPIERDSLKTFLESRPGIRQVDRYTFELDGRLVDFSEAAALPAPARGIRALQAGLLAWLANQPFALRIFDRMSQYSQKKIRKELRDR